MASQIDRKWTSDEVIFMLVVDDARERPKKAKPSNLCSVISDWKIDNIFMLMSQ